MKRQPAAADRQPAAGHRPPALPASWRAGEAAVVGLARSGVSASRLLRSKGLGVYASDAGDSEPLREAKQQLERAGCSVELGRHDLERIAKASVVVASPGVPPGAPPLRAAREAGVPIEAELGLAARLLPDTKLVVITGTKGKSSVSAMIAAIIGEPPAGNIGAPLSDVALRATHPVWLAVEASSFQLHDTPALAPAAGVLTNLSADHLDRYDNVGEYYADKALLFRNATADSHWVINGDDREVVALGAGTPGTVERFSLDVQLADAWFDRAAGWLILRGMPLMRRADLRLLGDHNVMNALAAALAAPAGTDRDHIAASLAGFRSLHHRLEPVREVNGVLWVNDSKATTVSAARSGVESVGRPVVLLVGGKDKGGDFRELLPALKDARAVIAFGEAGERIERELAGTVKLVREGSDFDAILNRARGLARQGDAVLLSPACSSFDMFRNAEDRGEQFTAWVRAL